MSFAKLDSGIINSTIWVLPHDVLRVWIWFLSQADAQGVVRTAAPALAHACMVPLDRTRAILELLESPDPDSRSDANEGRRIAKVPGGWQIVNYRAYRERVSGEEKRENDRERIAAKRSLAMSKPVADCRDVSQPVATCRDVSQPVADCRDVSQPVENVANVAQAEAEEEEEIAKASELRSAQAQPKNGLALPSDEQPAPDPIWGTGLAFLARRRIPERQARSLLGKLRKACGDIAAGALLAQCEAQDISDPAPWLMAAAGQRNRDGPKPISKTMQAIQILERMKPGAPDEIPRLAAG